MFRTTRRREKKTHYTYFFQDTDTGKQGTQRVSEILRDKIFVDDSKIELGELPRLIEEGKAVFCLVVPIESLENLVMELCDAILS